MQWFGCAAAATLALAQRFGLMDRLNVGLHIKTTTITGFLLLRTMARLKPWRRRTWRFAEEHQRIQHWLEAIRRHAHADVASAVEIASCAKLLKGYGDTHRRGRRNFVLIFSSLVDGPAADAAAIRRAREAALADPEGDALDNALALMQQQGGSETRPYNKTDQEVGAGLRPALAQQYNSRTGR
jgi:indolepyruvate ferredoxin oxidoreductase beta subunit